MPQYTMLSFTARNGVPVGTWKKPKNITILSEGHFLHSFGGGAYTGGCIWYIQSSFVPTLATRTACFSGPWIRLEGGLHVKHQAYHSRTFVGNRVHKLSQVQWLLSTCTHHPPFTMTSLVEVAGAVGVAIGLRERATPTLNPRTMCSVGKVVSMYYMCLCVCWGEDISVCIGIRIVHWWHLHVQSR